MVLFSNVISKVPVNGGLAALLRVTVIVAPISVKLNELCSSPSVRGTPSTEISGISLPQYAGFIFSLNEVSDNLSTLNSLIQWPFG